MWMFLPVRAIRGLGTFVLGLALAIAAAGCGGDQLQGTYHQTSGAMSLDFKGDKVTFNMLGESKTLDYKVDGNSITITDPVEGNMVFTRNSDGTLNSGLGTFAKAE
jgi:hypothetical protein